MSNFYTDFLLGSEKRIELMSNLYNDSLTKEEKRLMTKEMLFLDSFLIQQVSIKIIGREFKC